MQYKPVNYCPQCGSQNIETRIPPNDTHPRLVCKQCAHIIYYNPTLITGCIVEHQERVLLVQRAIEPMRGKWTIPAGFLETGETVEQAAIREVLEESGAQVNIVCPYSIFSVPQTNQVYIIFKAQFLQFVQPCGDESLTRSFMKKKDIPWQDLSYPAIAQILQRYLDEKKTGQLGLYMGNFDQGMVHYMQS